jgi:SAM-dependent methyltransferase
MVDYVLDNGWRQARERLAALEAAYDPATRGYLDDLGVGPGWRCLEVGAGGGSIAAWLAERVGPRGHVLATDLDPRFLAPLAAPTLEIRRHDLAAEDLPAGRFDLVHARLLLMHLPDPARALARLAAALRPGGWLLVEEQDFASRVPDPAAVDAALVARCEQAWERHVRARGMDPTYGRRLYGAVRARGLGELGAEGRVRVVRGGTSEARIQQLSFAQLHDGLLATGLVTAEDLARFLALHDDPAAVWLGPALISVWGRKPPV